MKKNILGLDLGTTSIGFAHVIEGETPEESNIRKIGVRVNPLSTDEQTDFEKGKPITINADRTLKRGMRRRLDRYQMRRENLIQVLKEAKLITDSTILTEDGKQTTFQTWALRARAVTERVEKEELARIFLAINKKRGYKSSRKAKSEDEGQIIDGMAIAKELYENQITPGQWVFQKLMNGKRSIPDFYRSDLKAELDRIWEFQSKFYPEVLSHEFYQEIQGKGLKATTAIFWTKFKLNTADIKTVDQHLINDYTRNASARFQKKIQAYYWRSQALSVQLELDQLAYVIAEVNNNLNNSSGYLGAISDRSKELYFNKKTIGQLLYEQLKSNPHAKLKNQVFYRQDYLDEFEAIWSEQTKHHSELSNDLKTEIRDIIIFYQRKLKSQKNLVALCEFERNDEFQVIQGDKKVTRSIGNKVAPKSSPLFQEFKIWQNLSNVLVKKKGTRKRIAKNTIGENSNEDIQALDITAKESLFVELNIKGKLPSTRAIELIGLDPKEFVLNYETLEGNQTNKALYAAFLKIIELEGYEPKEIFKIKTNKDDLDLEDITADASEIKSIIRSIFESLNIDTAILDFDPLLEGQAFELQPSYQLWHLLYSYEGDNSKTGNDHLCQLLHQKFGFTEEHGKILATVVFSNDYGSLSSKAIRKMFPFIKENTFSSAAALAGYRHSASSLTSEEIEKRPLKDKLSLLKKNSLRNPVVEKILNQMINVVNTILEENKKIDPDFRFDEIRIELARELKKNANERAELTSDIGKAKANHDKITKVLQSECGIKNPSRNDIIRYKLYQELKSNGYKDLYTDTYIPLEILFSKQIDVDHIIPQSRLFDDSFSNKTLAFRKDNLKKSNRTAIEFIEEEFGKESSDAFLARIDLLHQINQKNKEEGISKAKFLKLQKRSAEIGEGFIQRDLRDSQYIAKKAKNILFEITRRVTSTSGSITDRLRDDWGLVNIMQELNFEKYKKLGLTEKIEKKDGNFKERIVDWNKRNDHRHHAMDALTVAFTKPSLIQYLNHLNARYNEGDKHHPVIKAIEAKETQVIKDDEGNSKRVFNSPIPSFREQAKEHLENVIVSHKAKNKVVTKNKNKIKTKDGVKVKTELTPRGQLHKETVYGKRKRLVAVEEKVSGKFDLATIAQVANGQYRELLTQRLLENDNDPKKAFTGKNALTKNPIFLDIEKSQPMPEKVTLHKYEEIYVIRKDISPDLKIDKVVDEKVKEILQARLDAFDNDAKKAFSDLEKNPIWLNKSKGIAIKRVTITGISNAEALHVKKDHFGKEILDQNGQRIPVDFVSTGNNHHVAIYQDADGNLQERVVSLFEAVQLVNQGLPVIDRSFNQSLGWKFLFSMKQNEYFVFPNPKEGFHPSEIDLLDPSNRKSISANLYRVQKLASKNYFFRHHLETNVEEKPELKNIAFKPQLGLSGIRDIVKVRVNHTGDIIHTGE